MINWRSMVSEMLADRRGDARLPARIERMARRSFSYLRRRLAMFRSART